MTIIKGATVTRPTPDPIKSSVLDHATVVDLSEDEGFGWQNDEGLWPSYNCLDTIVPTPLCPDPLSEKVFAFGEWQPALSFGLHGGIQCKTLGLDRDDMLSELRRVFALNEGKGVEQALLLNRFVALATPAPPARQIGWSAPVDLTVSGPTGLLALQVAVANLEGYAAAHYAGVPTIHMPRAAANLLNERIVWNGDKAFTRNGSKVAIGGGYDAEGVPSGTFNIFATGEVYVERSAKIEADSYVLPEDGNGVGSGDTGLSDNTTLGLAERLYRVAVDCFVAKASAVVWS